MKLLKAKTPVLFNGVILEPGTKFSCTDEQAEKFIESKTAVQFIEKKTKATENEGKPEGGKEPVE